MSTLSYSLIAVGWLTSADPSELAVKIDRALEESDPAAMESAARELAASLGDNVLGRERLNEALEGGDLRAALREVKEIITFEPLIEADLPEGFPEPTPLGEIRVKQYPAYRLARTERSGGGNGAFWALFQHIKKNDVAMTAPVEMTYGDAGGLPEQKRMAFLYGSRELGDTGEQGRVTVADVPPMTAVSLGLRGNSTPERIADAGRRLEEWLASHADEYERSGELRVMGYNSPFVPAARRFYEVELPVRKK